MKKVKFVLNPHERKELKRFLGYLNINYVIPASKLLTEIQSTDKQLVGSYCYRSYQFWQPFQYDKQRLDHEIRKALLEIDMAYKYVLSDGYILDDSCKYTYIW